ncbi:unnamed protein product, partial [Symbiodinium microadriaticum]
ALSLPYLVAKDKSGCPDWKHYSDFVKARTCLLLVDVEACYPQFETDVEKKEMRRRFQQVGAALRLATGPTSVEPQEAAEDSATVKRAFAGDLSVSEEKKMLTGLFTYHGVDGIPRAGCRQPNVEVKKGLQPKKSPSPVQQLEDIFDERWQEAVKRAI